MLCSLSTSKRASVLSVPIFSPGFIVVLFLMIEIVYGQGDDIFDDNNDQYDEE